MENLQRVLIVDGHPLLKSGLRALLDADPDIEVLAEADDAGEAADANGELTPHLLLLDRTVPGTDDIEAVAQLKRRYPDARVLMITPQKTEDYARASLRAGANACIHQDATHEEFRLAIRNALPQGSRLGMVVSREVIDAYLCRKPSSPGSEQDALTQREREVLKLVAVGKSSKRIAEYLGLSVKTVAKHRSNLMSKLDLHNAARLTAYAIERGLVFM